MALIVLLLRTFAGGTNTDAAILRGRTVLGAAKAWTTPDVTLGISQAVKGALKAAAVSKPPLSWPLLTAYSVRPRLAEQVIWQCILATPFFFADAADVSLASLGTTSFLNAVIQRKGLAKVALLRLCGKSTSSLPPFCDLPAELCAAIEARSAVLQGEKIN